MYNNNFKSFQGLTKNPMYFNAIYQLFEKSCGGNVILSATICNTIVVLLLKIVNTLARLLDRPSYTILPDSLVTTSNLSVSGIF
jgi:hypothetical protein